MEFGSVRKIGHSTSLSGLTLRSQTRNATRTPCARAPARLLDGLHARKTLASILVGEYCEVSPTAEDWKVSMRFHAGSKRTHHSLPERGKGVNEKDGMRSAALHVCRPCKFARDEGDRPGLTATGRAPDPDGPRACRTEGKAPEDLRGKKKTHTHTHTFTSTQTLCLFRHAARTVRLLVVARRVLDLLVTERRRAEERFAAGALRLAFLQLGVFGASLPPCEAVVPAGHMPDSAVRAPRNTEIRGADRDGSEERHKREEELGEHRHGSESFFRSVEPVGRRRMSEVSWRFRLYTSWGPHSASSACPAGGQNAS